MVSVLSDEEVDGADADTLLTTEDTMERSTGQASQPRRLRQPIYRIDRLCFTYFCLARRPVSAPGLFLLQSPHNADSVGCAIIERSARMRALFG